MTSSLEWQQATLAAVRDLSRDIRLFEISTDAQLGEASPGGHIKIVVSVRGRPDVRSYSIVGLPEGNTYRIAVKLLPNSRGGSAYMWGLAVGARLTISLPANQFQLRMNRPDYVLVAGGVGIAPIYTMALALAEAKANFKVLYAVRRRDDLALADDLAAIVGDRLTCLVGDEGQRVNFGEIIPRLSSDGELYICGPLGMLEAAKRTWHESGRPIDGMRFETFGTSGHFPTQPFQVRIPRLGLVIDVPADRSMLEALEEAGVAVISDCRRGECGLCALNVLDTEGIIDHRDVFFSDQEKAAGTKLCTCVARVAAGAVVVDTADRVREQRVLR